MKKITRKEFLSLMAKTFLGLIIINLKPWEEIFASSNHWLREEKKVVVIPEKPFSRYDLYQYNSLAG